MAISNTIVVIVVESVASLYKYGGRVDASLQTKAGHVVFACI